MNEMLDHLGLPDIEVIIAGLKTVVTELETVITQLEHEKHFLERKHNLNNSAVNRTRCLRELQNDNPCYGCEYINPSTNMTDLEYCKLCGADLVEVSNEEALKIIDSRIPKGRFYTIEKGSYIGIDNQTGEAWTEDFENKLQCFKFLYGEENVAQGDSFVV